MKTKFKMFEGNNIHLSGNGDWVLFAGLSGGFGGAIPLRLEKDISKDDAEKLSYQLAIEEYENYEGMYGLRDVDNIMEEDEVDAGEAEEIRYEEMENWLDYYVEPYNPEKHDIDLGI